MTYIIFGIIPKGTEHLVTKHSNVYATKYMDKYSHEMEEKRL